MIKALIIDDEHLARSIIVSYLAAYPNIEIVQECENGFEGLKAIQQYQPDLIFLDIQMPKITGLEMLELVDEMPSVIFTTAFDEYAIKAFEANAIDYLLKPFNEERFKKAMEKFLNKQPLELKKQTVEALKTIQSHNNSERIVVKTGSKIKVISVYDIKYLAADDDYVNIHTEEGAFLKSQTLGFFEKNLDERIFVRVHRSYIVKLDQITKIELLEKDSHIVILKSGEKIPVSKTGYPKLKAVLGI